MRWASALAAVILLLPLSVVGSVASLPLSALRTSPATTTVQGYDLQSVRLPNFAYLSSYVYNYHGFQYPVNPFSGPCVDGILYIDNSSRLDCYTVSNSTSWHISAPLTLLYQVTSGIAGQIDNEFQLDTPYDVAILYGNLTTSAGPVTIETVNLTTGTILEVTTPVPMGNSIQCDYVGNDLVVTLNGTGSNGAPEITNLSNGTSWRSGLAVGVATNNAYWVSQLNAFIDVAGPHIAELKLTNGDKSMKNVGNAWINYSGVSSVEAVNGAIYNASTGTIAVELSTNLGNEVGVVKLTGGVLTPKGAYGYLTGIALDISRYAYSSGYVWSTAGGITLLFDPIRNSTETTVPNLVTRSESSGADNNYEFTDPYSLSTYVSFNVSLLGIPVRAPNQFVWASIHPSGPAGGGGGSGSGPTTNPVVPVPPVPNLGVSLQTVQEILAVVGISAIAIAIFLRGKFGILVGIVGAFALGGAILL